MLSKEAQARRFPQTSPVLSISRALSWRFAGIGRNGGNGKIPTARHQIEPINLIAFLAFHPDGDEVLQSIFQFDRSDHRRRTEVTGREQAAAV